MLVIDDNLLDVDKVVKDIITFAETEGFITALFNAMKHWGLKEEAQCFVQEYLESFEAIEKIDGEFMVLMDKLPHDFPESIPEKISLTSLLFDEDSDFYIVNKVIDKFEYITYDTTLYSEADNWWVAVEDSFS